MINTSSLCVMNYSDLALPLFCDYRCDRFFFTAKLRNTLSPSMTNFLLLLLYCLVHPIPLSSNWQSRNPLFPRRLTFYPSTIDWLGLHTFTLLPRKRLRKWTAKYERLSPSAILICKQKLRAAELKNQTNSTILILILFRYSLACLPR